MRLSILLSVLPLAVAAPSSPQRAPLLRSRDADSLIAGTYIVKFKDGSSALSALNDDDSYDITGLGVNVVPEHVFTGAVFNGFSGKLDEETLDLLRDHPDVEYIEQDAIVKINAEQVNAPWGLARISSRTRGATSYFHEPLGGTGACAYVLDTGVDVTHPDFQGRATWAANFAGGSNTDVQGHGTHVAGIIGGRTYGVAKSVRLYAVKALGDNGAGSISQIIQSVNFVATDSASRVCPNGVYANLSIGGGFSAALNSAVASLVARGIFVGVAAGNSNADVANFSPASEPSVCTVGSSDINDVVASSSNYGAGLDIYAPGRQITSAWPGGGSQVLSGSSMASPHVVGIAAYIASIEGTSNAGGLCARIQELATPNVLTGVPPGTRNLLAFNGWGII